MMYLYLVLLGFSDISISVCDDNNDDDTDDHGDDDLNSFH